MWLITSFDPKLETSLGQIQTPGIRSGCPAVDLLLSLFDSTLHQPYWFRSIFQISLAVALWIGKKIVPLGSFKHSRFVVPGVVRR